MSWFGKKRALVALTGFVAICMFVGGPFALLAHDHAGEHTGSDCAVCVYASSALQVVDTYRFNSSHLTEFGLVRAHSDDFIAIDVPGENTSRAPPSA